MLPMLAVPLDVPIDELIEGDWACEPKADGRRIVTGAQWIGRDGQVVTPTADIRDELFGASCDWDAELVGNRLYVFDIVLINDDTSIQKSPWSQRREVMEAIFERWNPNKKLVRLMPAATTPAEKRKMVRRVKRNRGEGVVFKRTTSAYQSGRSRDWRKAKYVKSCDVIVTGVGIDGKDNYSMGLLDGDKLLDVGTVAGFTGDGAFLAFGVGDVIEVECLYASESGRLVQPVKPKLRTDKHPTECTVDQLASLQTSKDYLTRMTTRP